MPESELRYLDSANSGLLVPAKDLATPSATPAFSSESWIILDDVTSDKPILNHDRISERIARCSFKSRFWSLAGLVMIQRFVVICEGKKECLCLGIHT
jgi:hypothetical protein